MLTSLSDMQPGQSGLIIGISAVNATTGRLMELGMVPGQKVRVMKLAPLGDPIEIEIMNYHLCLRRCDAKDISVECIDKHEPA